MARGLDPIGHQGKGRENRSRWNLPGAGRSPKRLLNGLGRVLVHHEGKGYAAPSIEAALWAFHRSDNFRDGLLLAVNLGDDADTTGAVYGQIARAHYGYDGIPKAWRERIVRGDDIVELARAILRKRP